MPGIPVSVIIPAYNAQEWLGRAVHSALGQGVDEVVIVDDGSTDTTAQIAQGLAAVHPSINFRSLPRNCGAAHARREAVSIARNEWIAPLDSDDYLATGAVAQAYHRVLDDHADICLWTMYQVNENRTKQWPDIRDLRFPMSGREAARLTLHEWRIHPLGVMRKDLFVSAAASVQVTPFNSDELVTRSLFLACRKVTSCSASYFYVENHKSTTRATPQDPAQLAISQAWLLNFARDNGFLDEDPALARAMVRHGLHLAENATNGSIPPQDMRDLLGALHNGDPGWTHDLTKELYRSLRRHGTRQRILRLRRKL